MNCINNPYGAGFEVVLGGDADLEAGCEWVAADGLGCPLTELRLSLYGTNDVLSTLMMACPAGST